MSAATPQAITIAVPENEGVSGLLQVPPKARACYVLAHGAGAGMAHSFLAAMADGLCERGIATLRYQFLYMQKGGRRPDPPKLAHAAVRAAVREAARQLPDVPLFAGGKSFGGRMTSQAQADSPLPGVRGLLFLGFPLHPPGKPSNDRAKHLEAVSIPMIFLQGLAMSLRNFRYWSRFVATLALASPLGCFRRPITRSMSPYVPDETMLMCASKF